jgi:hypothetical protein
MTNQKTSGALAAFVQGGNVDRPKGSLGQALQSHVEDTASAGGDFEYISYSAKVPGRPTCNRGATTIPSDMEFMYDPNMQREGWVCWKNKRPVGKVTWSIFEPGVPMSQLEDHGPYNEKAGEGWTKTVFYYFIGDDGKQYEWSVNAKGCINAAKDAFLRECIDRDKVGDPVYPIIRWEDEEEFDHQYGTSFKPVFVVEAWLDKAQAAEWISDAMGEQDEGPHADPEPELEPEPEPEPEPEVVQPRQRRSRRRANAA